MISIYRLALLYACSWCFGQLTATGTETRCYCNDSGCVTTGYMCKSSTLGVCYSRLTSDGATVRSTHGCAESLPEVEYSACSRLTSTSDAHKMSLLLCCHHDMCNYRTEVPPPGPKHSQRSKLSSDSAGPHHRRLDWVTQSSTQRTHSQKDSNSVVDQRTCLRIAIIVTPIIGICVLVPIIVIAIRLLAGSERRRTHRSLVLPSLQQKTPHGDSCPYCGETISLCSCASSRTKFVVVTSAQSRRSPGGGYQQIVQPPTTVYPCRCCRQNARLVHDLTDRTAFPLDADVDGDFV